MSENRNNVSKDIRLISSAMGYFRVSDSEMADLIGIARPNMSNIMNGKSKPKAETLKKMRRAMELKGAVFTSDGVTYPKVTTKVLSGADGFQAFMDHVYDVASSEGGELCAHNIDPNNWIKWLGEAWNKMHSERMAAIADNINFKITCKQGEQTLLGSKHAEYRGIPNDMWSEKSFYVYGDNMAHMIFSEDDVTIIVIKERDVTESFRALFNVMWDTKAIKSK